MLERIRRSFATLTPRQWSIFCILAIASIGLALAFALLFRAHNRFILKENDNGQA